MPLEVSNGALALRGRPANLLDRAGRWLVCSGILESTGGMARYYLADQQQCRPVSNEITGYSASAFVYLYTLGGEQMFLNRARAAAHFLLGQWDSRLEALPFEPGSAESYFFDCGIVLRGLLAVWRQGSPAHQESPWTRPTNGYGPGQDGNGSRGSSGPELLSAACRLGRHMARDFGDPLVACGNYEFHPVLRLPHKTPAARDGRWSRNPGCYQLKAALGWRELYEATGEREFEEHYLRALECSLAGFSRFLPGPDPAQLMDRLHPYCYFLEGLLPAAESEPCAAALAGGLGRVSEYLEAAGGSFVRSDVYAQLLRLRIYADWAGIAPLNRAAARAEAETLRRFQATSGDIRVDGGFYFGSRCGQMIPHINPVSTIFALQALDLWQRYLEGAGPARSPAPDRTVGLQAAPGSFARSSPSKQPRLPLPPRAERRSPVGPVNGESALTGELGQVPGWQSLL